VALAQLRSGIVGAAGWECRCVHVRHEACEAAMAARAARFENGPRPWVAQVESSEVNADGAVEARSGG
jgi:hypothetical protein